MLASSSLRRATLLVSFLLMPCTSLLATPHEEEAPAENPNAYIAEHIGDAHMWHFATVGYCHIALDLPVILYHTKRGWHCFWASHLWDGHHHPIAYHGFIPNAQGKLVALDGERFYDLSITKNVAAMWLSVLLLLLLLVGLACGAQQGAAPRGPLVLLLLVVTFLRNQVARPYIGEHAYRKFLPYLLTIFSYIALNNLLGLLPGGANITGNISATLVLGLATLAMTLWHANRAYWAHIFRPPGVPLWVLPIMVPIELMGIITKTMTLIMRLFANILAGHLGLLSILGILFSVKPPIFAASISVPLATFLVLLKIFVSFLQAYIFTLLSAISIGSAVADHEHHGG